MCEKGKQEQGEVEETKKKECKMNKGNIYCVCRIIKTIVALWIFLDMVTIGTE